LFKEGVIEEVKGFKRLKVKKENSSNKVIGIREISNFLDKNSSIEEAKEFNFHQNKAIC
jgi:tRNA delta(2)-isopentenylpyrophosphate transferase